MDFKNDKASLDASATICTCTGSYFFCGVAEDDAGLLLLLLPFDRPSSSLTTEDQIESLDLKNILGGSGEGDSLDLPTKGTSS